MQNTNYTLTRSSKACLNCKSKKIKCSRSKITIRKVNKSSFLDFILNSNSGVNFDLLNTCESCYKSNINCQYVQTNIRRGPKKQMNYKQSYINKRISELNSRLKESLNIVREINSVIGNQNLDKLMIKQK